MFLKLICHVPFYRKRYFKKTFLIVKLTAFLLLAVCLQAGASGYAQKITLSQTNVSLKKIFKEIERQSEYHFFYKDRLLKQVGSVSVNVSNASVEEVLEQCFKEQPLTYAILDKTIVIKEKKPYAITVPASIELANVPAHIISGSVKDAQGNPLAGVSVIVRGTNIGTSTATNGNFSIEANTGDVLEFTIVGYQKKSVNVGKQTDVNIVLELEISGLSDVVVVGYGTQKRSSVTGSISKIQNDKLDQVPFGQIGKALAGRLSGVHFRETSGAAGVEPDITIRGLSSISGGNSPLIVIDGFPGGSLNQVNMNDVESFEVLKDASASAIYGSRGSGGVILITTKRGLIGKPKFNLNAYYGVSKAILFHDWMLGDEWYSYLTKYQNREFLWAGGDPTIPIFGDPARPVSYQVNPRAKESPQTVWQDEVFQAAPMQNYNLSVRGGGDAVKYYVSGTIGDEAGTLKATSFKQYHFRMNLDVRINKFMDFNVELTPSYNKRRAPYLSDLTGYLSEPPFVSPVPVEGRYPRASDYITTGFSANPSPYQFLYGAHNYVTTFSNLGRGTLRLKILDGLDLRSTIGTNLNYSTTNNFYGGINDPSIATSGSVINSQNVNLINENVLNYNKNFNKAHNVNAVLGASYQKNKSEVSSLVAQSNSYNNVLVQTLNNAIINAAASSQSRSMWGLISYFGRINYSFKDRYVVSASYRTDGSSRFGPNNKWGSFPSVSAAWLIAKEKFMQNLPAISNLKIRGSYGVTGNFNIGDFQYLGVMGSGVYSPNNTTVKSTAEITISNPNLSWEKVNGYDVGVELGLFENRLNIEFDYYNKETRSMLYSVNVPAVTGFTTALDNIGNVRNSGFDIDIRSSNLRGKFKWNTTANISFNKNEVIDLGSVDERINNYWSMGWILRKGVPMFSYYAYEMIGVFQNTEQIDQLPHIAGTKPGNPIIKDQNKDGKIDPVNDRIILGNFMPKVLLGFTNEFIWKDFDLTIFFQGSLGSKVFNAEVQTYQGTTNGPMRRSLVENEWWSEDEPGDGKTPALALSQLFGWNMNTDFYIQDASYLRLRDINLGYTISNWNSKSKKALSFFDDLRVYLAMTNLHIFKSKENQMYNPEGATLGFVSGINSTPGYNRNSGPVNRTYTIGINLSF